MPSQESSPETTSKNPAHVSGSGPTVGIIVIVVLLLAGAIYFVGARMPQSNTGGQLPLIPGTTTAE